jgi:hypothetical protein
MRRFLIIAGVLVGLVVAGGGAMLVCPQISELVIKLTCSMTDPSATCQERMLATPRRAAAAFSRDSDAIELGAVDFTRPRR